MKITVVGCGRWGSLIAWYLCEKRGHDVTLYGRRGSDSIMRFIEEGRNDLIVMPSKMKYSIDPECLAYSDVIVISIGSQGLDDFMHRIKPLNLRGRTFVLCMKGIDIKTGKRLSEVVRGSTHESNKIAVWLGPGHVQEFYAGIPNCMVIDSDDELTKAYLVDQFSSELIRFYIGEDLLGNEIGAAAKNVIGIAAGILDGLELSTLKGALMSRGTREVARLIARMGGDELSAYGLCHLGDYEATVFSKYSHNREYGEMLVRGERYDQLAEGHYTAKAIKNLADRYGVDMPICQSVYSIIYERADPREEVNHLFSRSIKTEFYK